MERVSISDVLELALNSASNEYQAQSTEVDRDKRASSGEIENDEEQPNRKRKRDTWLDITHRHSTHENDTRPTCPICLQPYTNRSYLRPCYHSFCFQCIAQWFKVGKMCPLCKQHTTSIVYNVSEKSGTFLEYTFGDEPFIPQAIYDQAGRNAFSSFSSSSSVTMGQRTLALRRRIYHDNLKPYPGYPPVSRRHTNTTHIEPFHIAKVEKVVNLKCEL